jgi:uncharacterized membrane protein
MPVLTGQSAGYGRIVAVVLAAALALAACGDQKPADPSAANPSDPANPAARTTGGDTTTTSSGLAAVTAPSGPLDTSGWVLAPPFYASGDEPFFRLEIIDGWFSFKRSAMRAIEEPLVDPRKENGADVFETGGLKVHISSSQCETQGRQSEFIVTVTYDGVTYDGCAFMGSTAAVANTEEAAMVAESVDAVDACLKELGQPALITGIVPRQDGEVKAMALRAKNGALFECGVTTANSAIAYLDAIEQGSQMGWMSQMRFLREGVVATAPCAEGQDVRNGETLLGRMLAKACKF